jgi:hypothetical protein
MAPLFPSYAEIERRRFPAAATLLAELDAAGYIAPTFQRLEGANAWPVR